VASDLPPVPPGYFDPGLHMAQAQSYGWQRFYEAAILETNRAELLKRVQAAQAAIEARITQLQSNHQDSSDERQAISDALAGLRLLQQEVVTPRPSPRASEPRL
jgi:hypothetical protein